MIWNQSLKKNQETFQIYAYEIAKSYTSYLNGSTPKQVIQLEEQWRGWLNMDWNWAINWQQVIIDRSQMKELDPAEYLTVLKLGTFHANGYYRQSCMEQLAGYDGALPFLILRLNDWVFQIRECAFQLVQKRLKICDISELFGALPMFEKVKKAERREREQILEIEKQIHEILSVKILEISMDEIHTYHISVKNEIYRIFSNYKILNADQMNRLIILEKTGYGKTLLIRSMLQNYPCSKDQMEQYLQSKNSIVRYYALVCRYEKQKEIWDGIEDMLMDKSKRIREYVSYLLKKHSDFSVLDYYKKQLEKHVTSTAVLGIGEHGNKGDIAWIEPFLESEIDQIAAAALLAYGNLAAQEGEACYWKYLFDCRQMISVRAYRLIQKYKIRYGASTLYHAYVRQENPVLKKYLLNLLFREPSWNRLPFLLRIYGQENLPEVMKDSLCKAMMKRNMYAHLSAEQAQKIQDILQEKKDVIPKEIRKGILFDLQFVTD